MDAEHNETPKLPEALGSTEYRTRLTTKLNCLIAVLEVAIAKITKSMDNEWAKYGIRVNAIAPGYFITDVTQPLVDDKERYAGITARIPLGRWGKPEDLGGVAVFLASDASDYLTGQIIFVDGGWLVC